MPGSILTFGSHNFESSSVWFTIDMKTQLGQTGRPQYIHNTWSIQGRVGSEGDTESEITSKIAELQAALVPGGDLAFSLGGHSLSSASCINGTQIIDFAWVPGFDGAHGSGAENILRRTFRLVIGGTQVATSDTDIMVWHENIRGIGTGGPTIKPVRSLGGAVQAQQTEAFTEFWAIQSGYGIGLTGYPTPATAIWGATPGVYYVPEKHTIGQESPMRFGSNINTMFKQYWSYTCWSTVPLVAAPIGF